MQIKLLLPILLLLNLDACEATDSSTFLQIDTNSAIKEIANTFTSLQNDIKNLRSEVNDLTGKVNSKVNLLADNRESLKKFIDDNLNSLSSRQCTYEYKMLSIPQIYTQSSGCSAGKRQITWGYYDLNGPTSVIGFFYCCNW